MANREVDEKSPGTLAGLTPGPGLRFVVTFVATAAVLFVLYYFPYQELGISEGWATTYLEHYARVVGFILRMLEPSISVTHNTVSGRFAMSIVKSCDAMEANLLFCAAVLAMPGAWWRKFTGLLVGLAALVVANVIRLCSLYYVGVYFGGWFEVAHVDVWPLIMIAFALLDFVVCVRWLERKPETPGREGATSDAARAAT